VGVVVNKVTKNYHMCLPANRCSRNMACSASRWRVVGIHRTIWPRYPQSMRSRGMWQVVWGIPICWKGYRGRQGCQGCRGSRGFEVWEQRILFLCPDGQLWARCGSEMFPIGDFLICREQKQWNMCPTGALWAHWGSFLCRPYFRWYKKRE
jgi:hypothetical protein